MVYDAEKDAYTCAQGKNLQAAAVKKRRCETGYVQEVTVYECADCKGCPVKEQCIRQKKTDKNRSIQAEGVFAAIKEDLNFRRFLTRGNAHVTVEWYLVSMAYNILKLHHKIQTGRLGTYLFVPGAA